MGRYLTPFLLALAVGSEVFAAGPAPVDLRSTAPFAILAGAGITSTGGGTINGNVGASPIAGSAIGVTCPQVNGTIYAVDASGPACAVIDSTLLTTAKGDLTTAYNDAAGRTPTPTGPNLNPGLIPGSGNIGGMNLAPGLYKFTTTALITGSDVTLTGGPNDVWIFQCAQDLQLGSGIKVILAGGALAKNVFWQVGTSAVLGTTSVFKGTILADQAITMNTGSVMEGRALAFSAGVVFNGGAATLPVAPAPAPEIELSQPDGVDIADGGTKDFGSVIVGSNGSLTFAIRNAGTADLTGLATTIDGADASSFTLTASPTSPVAGDGGNTTFTVRFAPTSLGVKTAALHIVNNDADENPFDIIITGSGAPGGAGPEIAVEQPAGVDLADGGSKAFGSVAPGSNSNLTFTIRNTGGADLTGLAITIDGADSALFTVTANPTAPIVSGGNTTFTVRFSPTAVGARTAALHIANNDADENPFDITITGSGAPAGAGPEIAVEQPAGVDLADGASKAFGSVATGSNSNLTFTIRNTGGADLTGLTITIDGADSALFTVTANPTAPVVSEGNTTFTVRFAPTAVGARTAALHIANNDADENPFDITLTGTGTSPGGGGGGATLSVASFSPITFNPQTGLFEQTVRVTNAGPGAANAPRLLIQGLPEGVQVFNKSGTTNGTPFVQYNTALAAAASVDLLIEYYRANRQTIAQPSFAVEDANPVVINPAGTIIAINRNVQLTNGRFLIEFTATPGRIYAVQYSSDMTTWKTVVATITAPANRVQWLDDGPPKTESKPTAGTRFYQIVELP
jgi:hypothetical protein